MKTKILLIAALALATITFAQKKEVKALEKAIKSGSYGEAKTLVGAADALMGSMDDKTKEKFNLLKAQAFLGVGNKNIADLKQAAEAFKSLEGTKYAADGKTGLSNVVAAMVNSAVDDQNNNKFEEAGVKLEDAYQYSGDNKDYLFFAASNYLNAKNYTKASELFENLLDQGYKGQRTLYYAVNAETGAKKDFPDKQERDLLVLSKEYINPTEELSESRESTIMNYLIAIYSVEGNSEKALGLLDKAIAASPNDSKLLISKANAYLKMDRMDKYKEVISQVLEMDPTNAELHYNLGVSEDQLGNKENAKKYYQKTVELDPTYAAAYNNIAALILSDDQRLMDEMNNLGTSNADYDRYDSLKAQRKGLYKEAMPYLEKALAEKPDYLGVAKTLYNIYQQLGETSKADEVKAKIDALEAGK